MAKLSKAQKDELIERLSTPYATLELDCDGYRIGFQAQRDGKSGLRFVLAVFVNGWMKGEWMFFDKPCPEQKFMRRIDKPLFTKKEQAQWVKMDVALGMKRKDAIAKAAKTLTHMSPYFPSGRAAILHLCRVCEEIKVVGGEAA